MSRNVRVMAPMLLAVAASAVPTALAQVESVRPGINESFEEPDVEKFVSRFETESREIFVEREKIVAECGIEPGMSVADVGAGTGLFTRLFAKSVGPDGRVYAVDIAPEFVEHCVETAASEGFENVEGVVCTSTSVELPPDSVDLIFACNTYHHFEFPYRTMRTIHEALRPDGKFVLIDFHRIEGKTRPFIMNHVRAGRETVLREVASTGFRKTAERKDLLEENYFVVFEKILAPKGEPGTVREFVYKTTSDVDLSITVHFPTDWKADDRRPAIVYFFGGGWFAGSVRQFERQATWLAERGMVAMRAEYRVRSRHGVTPQQCVEDARSAVRWIRTYANLLGVDRDRLVAAGGSAGGHLAACTALAPGVDAANEDTSIPTRPSRLVLYNPVLDFAGDRLMRYVEGDEELAQRISPMRHLSKDVPPTLLLYGDEDPLVEQAKQFRSRAEELSFDVELFLAEGERHAFFNKEPWLSRTQEAVESFLEDYLSPRPEPKP